MSAIAQESHVSLVIFSVAPVTIFKIQNVAITITAVFQMEVQKHGDISQRAVQVVY